MGSSSVGITYAQDLSLDWLREVPQNRTFLRGRWVGMNEPIPVTQLTRHNPCKSHTLGKCGNRKLEPNVLWPKPVSGRDNFGKLDAKEAVRAALVANWIWHLGPQSSQTTEASHQCCQIRAVPFTHRLELQSQSPAGLHMPHHAIGSNLSLWDKKMNLGDRAYALHLGGLNEQPSDAQIRYAGHITISITFPVDPHTLPRLDP
jgi:hypothetical protein